MNRRAALKQSVILLGTTLVGSELFLSGCTRKNKKLLVFSKTDISLLDEIGETILPDSEESPGAKAANIGSFMTIMVRDCYTDEQQRVFMDGLIDIDKRSNKEFGSDFLNLSLADRTKLLTGLDSEATSWQKEEKIHYYTLMKQMTLLGYFTSEIGVKQALRYNPTPGSYDGCVPYNQDQPAWYGALSSIG